jgi:hypothetical protein
LNKLTHNLILPKKKILQSILPLLSDCPDCREMTELRHQRDPFNGVTVRVGKSSTTITRAAPTAVPAMAVTVTVTSDDLMKTFERDVLYSLQLWTRNGYRGVWFEIPLIHSHVIPILARLGG